MHTTQPQEAGSVDHAKTHTHNHTHTHTRAHKQTRRHTKTLIYNDRYNEPRRSIDIQCRREKGYRNLTQFEGNKHICVSRNKEGEKEAKRKEGRRGR